MDVLKGGGHQWSLTGMRGSNDALWEGLIYSAVYDFLQQRTVQQIQQKESFNQPP